MKKMTDEELWEGMCKLAKEYITYPTKHEEFDTAGTDIFTVLQVNLEIGGPTTYLEFWFNCDCIDNCDESTLDKCILYSNHVGYEQNAKMQEFTYFNDEAQELYEQYKEWL